MSIRRRGAARIAVTPAREWQSSSSARLRRVAPLLAFGVLLLIVGLWTTQVHAAASKDWRLFYDTASLLLANRIDEIYPGITPDLPFFYPPFFIWQVLPLGLVPREMAYGTVVLAMLLATAVALWALRIALDADRRPVETWIWFVLSSAGWTWMIVTGHISAWYLMLLSVALLFWAHDRPILAGVTLSLALTKPHYALVVLLFAALAGSWRIVVGAILGAALLVMSAYPLGWNAWSAWLAQAGAAASGSFDGTTAWKQITLRSFWVACFGAAHGRATAFWIATAAPAAALAVRAAWRSRKSSDRLPRVLGLAVLVALACGPYAFHYDGLLLAVPGLVWYFQPEGYGTSWVRASSGAMILATYVLQLLGAWFLQGRLPWPLTGLAITAWLALEAIDLSRLGAPAARPAKTIP